MSNLESGAPGEAHDAVTSIDLDLIERELRDVETTLARLADGTYFADRPVASMPGTDATGWPAPGLDT